MTLNALGTSSLRILDAISDGVYVTTAEREIVFWSQGAQRITGYTPEEVVGKHCYDDVLVHTDLHGKHLCVDGCPLQSCIETGIDRTVNEVFLKRKNGERLAVYVKTATFVEDGETYGIEIFGELAGVAGSDLVARVQELSDSSVTDPLSGMFNRRYFDAALAQQYALFRRTGRKYGVLSLDVDDFKAINDTLGHATGDEALKFVADIIVHNARRMDIAARYGGDEFALICSVASSEELMGYGKRLVGIVRDSSFGPAEGGNLTLTISAGGTLVDAGDATDRTALERADLAMYRAKRSGRDDMVVVDAADPDALDASWLEQATVSGAEGE